jgi:hypothetical protein
MSHTIARRTSTIFLLSVAIGAAIPNPAVAVPAAKEQGVAQICPGILCEPFWKTDRARILKKEP